MNEIGSAFEGKYYQVEERESKPDHVHYGEKDNADWLSGEVQDVTGLHWSICTAGRHKNTLTSRASIWFRELNRKSNILPKYLTYFLHSFIAVFISLVTIASKLGKIWLIVEWVFQNGNCPSESSYKMIVSISVKQVLPEELGQPKIKAKTCCPGCQIHIVYWQPTDSLWPAEFSLVTK